MFSSTPFTIRTVRAILYLLLGIVPKSTQYLCDRPKTNLVIVEVQMGDNNFVFCMGLWICSSMEEYIEGRWKRNSSCNHVLTSANCLKQDDINIIRVRKNYYKGLDVYRL